MVSFWFERTFNLMDNEVWKGMTEIHCHILPDVDDGVETKEDALQLLRFMERDVGVHRICMTPHTMMDFNNAPVTSLKGQFRKFCNDYSGRMELFLASEYMLDVSFGSHLKGEMLPLGEWDGRRLLLVETAALMPPPGLEEMLEDIFSAGYIPVIAHPERYAYMEESDYRRWKERGCLFQLNIPSLHGYYGRYPQKDAVRLLKQGMYDFAGFDIHRYEGYARVIRQLELSRKQLDNVRRLLENNENIQFDGEEKMERMNDGK
jgi:Capsular polysaccharide biosynthesis protein